MAEKTNDIPSNGSVQISDEVIAVVSSVASMEIDGIVGMTTSLTSGIAELIGKKSFSRGVKVELDGDNVKITVSVTVKYGCKIQEVAWQVQQNVKKAVENMTGLNVLCVNVCVSGVSYANEKKTAAEEADKETEEQ